MDLQSSLSTTCENPDLFQAIKKNKFKKIKFLLDNGTDVNAPLWKTGEFAGYTALHVACTKNTIKLVKLLIKNYKANVNLEADDGTHPIHLACFYDGDPIESYTTKLETLLYLLKAGANPDAEFGREIFIKHVEDEWRPDFGEKITPIIFSIIYDRTALAYHLTKVSSDLKVKSLKNKTLLMYAIEYNLYDVVSNLISAIEDPAYFNLEDDDGIPTIHYVLYPKKYNQFRYHSWELNFLADYKRGTMLELIKAGADKDALINGDPDTFLPNVAAYRSCSYLLEGLLTCYEYMPYSKVLQNAILPIDGSAEKMIRLNSEDRPYNYPDFMERIRRERQETIEVALKDLVTRRTFGLHTNEEEIKLMENLIATDKKMKNIVENFEGQFINGELKSKFINVDGKKISILDFLKQVFDQKKLKLWARDESVLEMIRDISDVNNKFFLDYLQIIALSYDRIKKGCKRFKLFKELDKISTLRKFINLPYEIILEFIKYLNNNEFNAFINAFIC